MSEMVWRYGLSCVLVMLCGWIAVADLRTRRIPDMASLLLILVGLGLSERASSIPLADRLIGAGAGFLLLWTIGEVAFRLRGVEALGIGDAKLFAAAGSWLGWAALPMVMLIAAVMGLVFATVRPGPTPKEVPFGPWLAAGFIIGWAWSLQPDLRLGQ